MNRYEGERTGKGPIVTVNGAPLNARLDLRTHNSTEFEWGCCGSGSAQLALAILADHLGDDEQALRYYQRFKWSVIAQLAPKRWVLTGREVHEALQRIRDHDDGGDE